MCYHDEDMTLIPVSGFEVAVMVYQIVQIRQNKTLSSEATADLSLSTTVVDLAQFIPGVTIPLVAFIVFGTTRSFLQSYRKMLLCQNRRRKPKERPIIRHPGQFQFQTLSKHWPTKIDWAPPENVGDIESQSTGSLIRNFSRPNASRPILVDTEKASMAVETKTVSLHLNKPLPNTPLESVEIGFVVQRVSEWMTVMQDVPMKSPLRAEVTRMQREPEATTQAEPEATTQAEPEATTQAEPELAKLRKLA